VNGSLTVNDIVASLVNTGTPVTDLRNNITKPRIDLYDAVYEALCLTRQVRISLPDPIYYSFIQEAYDAAFAADLIQVQALDFTEDLVFDRDIAITLEGGYDCGYTVNSAETVIDGSLTVSNGEVDLKNIVIQ
jgi:hypothetical protein